MTLLLSIAGCMLLFFGIWGMTVTLPTPSLITFFPEDIQEKLKPRLDNLPMSFKRMIGWIILIVFIVGYINLFIYGGIDGKRHGFTFWQYFQRFLTIGVIIKIFDIVCLDYFLLTKTHFFQHYFPETEGCEGWKQIGYNRTQQIRQCILVLIGSILMALIFTYLV